jgi:hypothetical protein
LLLKHLKIVDYTLVLVFNVGLVLAHVLLDFRHLFEVRVELELVEALLLLLGDVAPLGIPDGRL